MSSIPDHGMLILTPASLHQFSLLSLFPLLLLRFNPNIPTSAVGKMECGRLESTKAAPAALDILLMTGIMMAFLLCGDDVTNITHNYCRMCGRQSGIINVLNVEREGKSPLVAGSLFLWCSRALLECCSVWSNI